MFKNFTNAIMSHRLNIRYISTYWIFSFRRIVIEMLHNLYSNYNYLYFHQLEDKEVQSCYTLSIQNYLDLKIKYKPCLFKIKIRFFIFHCLFKGRSCQFWSESENLEHPLGIHNTQKKIRPRSLVVQKTPWFHKTHKRSTFLNYIPKYCKENLLKVDRLLGFPRYYYGNKLT